MIILRSRWKKFFFRWWAAPSRMRRCSPGSSRFQKPLCPLAAVALEAFCNSLRRPNRGAELGLQVFWFILGGLLVLLLCAVFFGATFAMFQTERADFLDLLLLALFLIWQLAPILLE